MIVLKWIKRVLLLILILAISFLGYIGVSSKITGKQPIIFGHQLMTVLTGSMEPTIKTGSIILVKPIEKADEFKAGDIITFFSAGEEHEVITHRIIEIKLIKNELYYMTKGDNNNTKDLDLVPRTNIIAVYKNFTIPYLGYVFSFISSKNGILVILFVPGVLLILSQIMKIWKSILKKNSKEKKEQAANLIKPI